MRTSTAEIEFIREYIKEIIPFIERFSIYSHS